MFKEFKNKEWVLAFLYEGFSEVKRRCGKDPSIIEMSFNNQEILNDVGSDYIFSDGNMALFCGAEIKDNTSDNLIVIHGPGRKGSVLLTPRHPSYDQLSCTTSSLDVSSVKDWLKSQKVSNETATGSHEDKAKKILQDILPPSMMKTIEQGAVLGKEKAKEFKDNIVQSGNDVFNHIKNMDTEVLYDKMIKNAEGLKDIFNHRRLSVEEAEKFENSSNVDSEDSPDTLPQNLQKFRKQGSAAIDKRDKIYDRNIPVVLRHFIHEFAILEAKKDIIFCPKLIKMQLEDKNKSIVSFFKVDLFFGDRNFHVESETLSDLVNQLQEEIYQEYRVCRNKLKQLEESPVSDDPNEKRNYLMNKQHLEKFIDLFVPIFWE